MKWDKLKRWCVFHRRNVQTDAHRDIMSCFLLLHPQVVSELNGIPRSLPGRLFTSTEAAAPSGVTCGELHSTACSVFLSKCIFPSTLLVFLFNYYFILCSYSYFIIFHIIHSWNFIIFYFIFLYYILFYFPFFSIIFIFTVLCFFSYGGFYLHSFL